MKLAVISSKKFSRILEKNGVYLARQGRTDHAIFVGKTATKKFAAPVQISKKELSPHYIKLVLKQLGFSSSEINKMFRK